MTRSPYTMMGLPSLPSQCSTVDMVNAARYDRGMPKSLPTPDKPAKPIPPGRMLPTQLRVIADELQAIETLIEQGRIAFTNAQMGLLRFLDEGPTQEEFLANQYIETEFFQALEARREELRTELYLKWGMNPAGGTRGRSVGDGAAGSRSHPFSLLPLKKTQTRI